MKTLPKLVPLLVVRGAAQAIDFYVRALGAEVLARFEHGPQQHLSHADLLLGGSVFSLTEELRAWNSDAPVSLGGSPVVLQLEVSDAEAVLASISEAGGAVVFPLGEFIGERIARVRDPFGHLWIVRERVEQLSDEEIRRRRDELFARFAAAASASTPAGTQYVTSLLNPPAVSQAPSARTVDAAPATPQTTENKGKIHLIVGPVGAGKSTFARRLERERQALRLSLDEWIAALFNPDRPDVGRREWYVERRSRCTEQICAVAKAAGNAGTETVLELGLLRRHERDRCYTWIEAGFELTIYVLDAAREVRRERVAARNVTQGETFSMLVPPEFFELASELWQPLEAVECEGRDVVFMRTDEA
ncbi:MAG TPA: AAA family ATPase [Polyangiaceae bacterium]|nr:AAA family ATPase [Polyangiaceae bacterium]